MNENKKKIDNRYGSREVELETEFVLREGETISIENMGIKLINVNSHFRDVTGDHTTSTIAVSADKKEETIEICIDQESVEGSYMPVQCNPNAGGCIFKKDQSLLTGHSYSSPISKANFHGYIIEMTYASESYMQLKVIRIQNLIPPAYSHSSSHLME